MIVSRGMSAAPSFNPLVPRETVDLLERLEALVRKEATRQNLVAASTVRSMKDRHIEDSLQILPLITAGPLLDIGSGAGFPGLAIACACGMQVLLVEPRAKRAAFLRAAVEHLGLNNVQVHQAKVQSVHVGGIGTITARAVAPLEALFTIASHLATSDTKWVLLKGRTAAAELAEARRTWQGSFELAPSRTDPEAAIVIAQGVRRK